MAKFKTGKWTPEETAQVQGIPKDAKLKQKLDKLCTKLNRPYANVYAKWNTEYKRGTPAKNVPAMNLEVDLDYVPTNSRIDEIEIKALELDLGKKVPLLQPMKGCILITRRLEPAARVYLDKHHAEHVYGFQAITGNNLQKRLIRKV